MLKAFDREGTLKLTRVRQETWQSERTPKYWQTESIILMQKRGRREFANRQDICLLRLPGKVYAVCFEKRCCETNDTQDGGYPVRFLSWP